MIYTNMYHIIYSYTILTIRIVCSPIEIMVKVFANGRGDQGSIPGRIIPKSQKMVLDASLLNTQNYKVQIKSKRSNPEKRVVPSPYTSLL